MLPWVDVKFKIDNVCGWIWKWQAIYDRCYFFCCCRQSGKSFRGWKNRFQVFLSCNTNIVFFLQNWNRTSQSLVPVIDHSGHGRGSSMAVRQQGVLQLVLSQHTNGSWLKQNSGLQYLQWGWELFFHPVTGNTALYIGAGPKVGKRRLLKLYVLISCSLLLLYTSYHKLSYLLM